MKISDELKSALINKYQNLLKGEFKGWVIFSHGTCVVVPHQAHTVEEAAIETLRRHGPVVPGGPQGDFAVSKLKDLSGWIVTGESRDILNFVFADEVKKNATDVEIGLLGRQRRQLDAGECRVIYIEKKN